MWTESATPTTINTNTNADVRNVICHPSETIRPRTQMVVTPTMIRGSSVETQLRNSRKLSTMTTAAAIGVVRRKSRRAARNVASFMAGVPARP